MKTSGDRLKALLDECGLTPADFAAQRRVSSQHVNNWFKRGVPLARLDALADLFCVHRRWLRSGEGPKYTHPILRMAPPQPLPELSPTSLSPPQGSMLQLPYQVLHEGELVTVDNHHLTLPAEALRTLSVPEESAICVVMPHSNMAPWIPRDAALAVDLSQTEVFDGETYALRHNGHLRVHSLSHGHNRTLCLHSHNNGNYAVERYTPAQCLTQGLEILGWVFHWSHFRQRRPS
ncbi:helix-turn-helix transcriptional regulator [Pseudomonas sp. NPDC089401]|uniref:LexA family transcriptional regulator n=1 Tax=Pseudomonas sp. NPDC089401 TaxID=3364462 RepID=UPI0038235296